MIQIKYRFTGDVLFESQKDTLREAVIEAVEVKANLYGASLSGASLSGANLSEASLCGASLSGANLSEADLSGANLSGAYLSGANLSRANLSGANLSGAYLYGASLYGASLSGASLSGANLSGADHIVSFGPVGNAKRIGYAVDHGDNVMFQLGCWWGDYQSTLDRIESEYSDGPIKKLYLQAVRWANRQVIAYREKAVKR